MTGRILVVSLLAVALASCGSPPTQPAHAPSAPAPAPSASGSPPGSEAPQGRQASAVPASSKPETQQAQLFFSTGGKLVPEAATVSATHPARDAVALLLRGPNAPAHYSDIPKAAQLLGVTRQGEVADVNFNTAFFTPGGATGMQLRLAQVVYTLTQFPHIRSVQFLEENKVESVAGEGFPISQPLTRQSFAGLGAA
jgi:spore germination protein GerM